MTGTETDPQPPRFPYVAALLCAACVGAAAWTWLRYSYAWDVTPDDLLEADSPLAAGGWEGFYVRLRGTALGGTSWNNVLGVAVAQPSDFDRQVTAIVELESPIWQEGSVAGRVLLARYTPSTPTVDTRLHRFTGASIAGLVVGAMGVFVFTVALRHWLEHRRMFD